MVQASGEPKHSVLNGSGLVAPAAPGTLNGSSPTANLVGINIKGKGARIVPLPPFNTGFAPVFFQIPQKTVF
jgi:hypothetical protein